MLRSLATLFAFVALLSSTSAASAQDPDGEAWNNMRWVGGQSEARESVQSHIPGEGAVRTGVRGCTGYFSGEGPSVALNYTPSHEGATLYVNTGHEMIPTMLLIHGPDGKWRCSHDSGTGQRPQLEMRAGAGRYAIFVGSMIQLSGAGASPYVWVGEQPR